MAAEGKADGWATGQRGALSCIYREEYASGFDVIADH